MPRRAAAQRREVVPDPVYNNRLVTQLDQQGTARRQEVRRRAHRVRRVRDHREEDGQDPLAIFKKAMDNVRPTLEVKPKRVGGATYQVPIEVNSRRSTTLAIRWIVGYSRKRREKTMAERLAGEIMDAANSTGASVKKREDLFKMAESNRAFSHYRW